MEGHRYAKLLVRAAVDGVVDFSKTELRNANWHRRLALLLGELSRKEQLEYTKILYERALRQATIVTDVETKNRLLEKADEHLNEYIDMQFGSANDKATVRKTAAEQLRSAWAAAYGDPNDPKVKQKIDAVVAGLEQQRTKRKQNNGPTV